jgi:hypothetical protein
VKPKRVGSRCSEWPNMESYFTEYFLKKILNFINIACWLLVKNRTHQFEDLKQKHNPNIVVCGAEERTTTMLVKQRCTK